MTTKAEFFARVRAEQAKTGGLFTATVMERPPRPSLVAETLRRELLERWPQALERFRHEFERVGGVFHRAASLGDVPAMVGGIARAHAARRLVTWHPSAMGADLTDELRGQRLEVSVMPPAGLDGAQADERQRLRDGIAAADLGLTGVDLAIAETGTLVLVSGGGRPRSTALLPPYHVAVFDRRALIETLQQVGVVLEAWHDGPSAGERGAAIHFITGPSRTADIELTLTRGVHGPKEVHAIFVDGLVHG